MTIRVALTHETRYRYDRLASLGPQLIRLRPAAHCRTPVTGYALQVEPAEHFLNWQQDPHGNFLARVVFPKPTEEFSVRVRLVAEMTVINPFDFFLEEEATEWPFAYSAGTLHELQPYLVCEESGPELRSLVAGLPREECRTVDFLVEVNRRIHAAVRYVIRLEPGVQTCEETLTKRSGSCRDSAWLLVQVFRQLGYAARFVSGYLIQLKPDVKSLDGPSGTDEDFTDLHAWTEVYLPGAGWIGLDPTSGLFAGEGHLPLAATPDPQTAAPISGLVSPCECEFDFQMRIERIHEAPRVTKPYSESQWNAILSLGSKIDQALAAGDVRLTMGGEPTFVSIDNFDGPEWNSTALSEEKRTLAGKLFCRLADRFASGPLLHYGQGKWYPGEQLPRWALGCFWRKDRQPIWKETDWIARDDGAYDFSEKEAVLFIQRLAERLEVGSEHAIPAYEDSWYYLWRERRLPTNVNPLDAKLEDPMERARLARVFEQGLKRVSGYVLPLRPTSYTSHHTEWESGRWFLRSEQMFLIPGDSPIGWRLPLDSLPWSPARSEDYLAARDPAEAVNELPARFGQYRDFHVHDQSTNAILFQDEYALAGSRASSSYGSLERSAIYPSGNDLGYRTPSRANSFPQQDAFRFGDPTHSLSVVRTAVCVEARQGILHVFMPPLGHVENYLHLLQAVEQTAAELRIPVRIEGYAPPPDRRLTHLRVTPDPGVIEVNLQPAESWAEITSVTTALYEEARLTRLGTEKFMLDGRHTGTGGGNHLVMGGATPQDSPFLRRPDLLRSLISYWNNHPSLSYLFSGLFIGPTSQAPRVDEARHESIYELETAFPQLSREATPPWLIDRVLRHLLVDVTGNTHRTEFCIDKLFSPDSSSGRLGLVEFRGFEMPPHARMSLAQQLLLRGLVAHFWRTPYTQPMIRWGTLLHDQFMLPHYLAQDFAEVMGDLTQAGLEFEQEWFAPHFEFRCPLIGRIQQRGIELELRQALEPWHVLGEEGVVGGTARYVDSSLERIQVKLRGMQDARHILTCNGRRVPLQRTETPGEYVAGIRFRAWQPPSCLHPTIGIHAPLQLELLDAWNQQFLGGCAWHVSHPGGRNYETFPVNSYEAESRRVARFFPYSRRVARVEIPPPETNRDYPHTLDLRHPVALATYDGVRTPS